MINSRIKLQLPTLAKLGLGRLTTFIESSQAGEHALPSMYGVLVFINVFGGVLSNSNLSSPGMLGKYTGMKNEKFKKTCTGR